MNFHMDAHRKSFFQENILIWYYQNKRNFFWRNEHLTPWNWLLLELLLKKTKAETVGKYARAILIKYPSPKDILLGSQSELHDDLRIFGLQNQRAKSFVKASTYLLENYSGNVPETLTGLLSIPYIGKYSAHAILCFCFNKKAPIVDVNVYRIISRFYKIKFVKDPRNEETWSTISKLLPDSNWISYNYGLLDHGALICRKKPKCTVCTLRNKCSHFKDPHY